MKSDTKVALIEQNIEHMKEMITLIHQQNDIFHKKIDAIDLNIQKRINSLDMKIDSNFRWLIATVISLFILNGFTALITHFLH